MATPTPEGLMYQIVRRIEEINGVASRMTGINHGVFGRVSLGMPKFDPSELGFIRSVSWLFVQYHEVGKVGVAFLGDRLSTYGIDSDGRLHTHPRLVQELRTYLQHNLDPTKGHDRAIQEKSERWLRDHCGTPVPGTDDQWKKCLLVLLSEAVEFTEGLLKVTRYIEQDESREEICREWIFRIDRYHPPHEFDELIPRVAADMGRENVDSEQLRTRYYEKWTRELNLLDAEYHFETEARKLIEHALLTATTPLPITGRDIMEEFDIPPGPRVRQLLELARRIYDTTPCSRDILLQQLRQQASSPPE